MFIRHCASKLEFYPMILTRVPSVTCSAKIAISSLCIRIHPFETAEPMRSVHLFHELLVRGVCHRNRRGLLNVYLVRIVVDRKATGVSFRS